MALVDLRSDTVTQPTADMRRAMADAVVGDDDYGEDPTVRALEDSVRRAHREAGVTLRPLGDDGQSDRCPGPGHRGDRRRRRAPSAPRGLRVRRRRRATRLSSSTRSTTTDGMLRPADVAWAREASAYHQPAVSLVSIENTHMAAGGAPWSMERLGAVVAAAGDVPVHLDGARLFNAEAATGVAASAWAAPVTTVMCCLSKGLCAPAGSLLAGPEDLITQARLERKRLGGGMRQAGVLAAPGLVALAGHGRAPARGPRPRRPAGRGRGGPLARSAGSIRRPCAPTS